jgi:hypothetical protein
MNIEQHPLKRKWIVYVLYDSLNKMSIEILRYWIAIEVQLQDHNITVVILSAKTRGMFGEIPGKELCDSLCVMGGIIGMLLCCR